MRVSPKTDEATTAQVVQLLGKVTGRGRKWAPTKDYPTVVDSRGRTWCVFGSDAPGSRESVSYFGVFSSEGCWEWRPYGWKLWDRYAGCDPCQCPPEILAVVRLLWPEAEGLDRVAPLTAEVAEALASVGAHPQSAVEGLLEALAEATRD